MVGHVLDEHLNRQFGRGSGDPDQASSVGKRKGAFPDHMLRIAVPAFAWAGHINDPIITSVVVLRVSEGSNITQPEPHKGNEIGRLHQGPEPIVLSEYVHPALPGGRTTVGIDDMGMRFCKERKDPACWCQGCQDDDPVFGGS